MFAQSNFTRKQLQDRYLIQLFGLQAKARRMKNNRVVIALSRLIEKVSWQNLGAT
jgi:hypothetical protein